MLDRMYSDGTWYSSSDTAELEEPVGILVFSPHITFFEWHEQPLYYAYYKGKLLERLANWSEMFIVDNDEFWKSGPFPHTVAKYMIEAMHYPIEITEDSVNPNGFVSTRFVCTKEEISNDGFL